MEKARRRETEKGKRKTGIGAKTGKEERGL